MAAFTALGMITAALVAAFIILFALSFISDLYYSIKNYGEAKTWSEIADRANRRAERAEEKLRDAGLT
jgi:uncharacterized membrane protein YhiD involved in acid resistance